jgi:imidazolonepropionase-like amidohydrolase
MFLAPIKPAWRLTKTRETEQNGKEAPLCLRCQQSIGEEFQMFQERRKQQGEMVRYLFRNAHILDAERGNYLAESSVLVEEDRILEVGGADVHASDAQSFDLHGLTLLPGLIDAHVHVTAVTADLGRLAEWSPAYVTARSARVLAGMLRRGFTTVRDVGGADYGLAQAIEEGYLEGAAPPLCRQSALANGRAWQFP